MPYATPHSFRGVLGPPCVGPDGGDSRPPHVTTPVLLGPAFSRARPRGAALLLGVIDEYSRIDAPVIYQHPLAYLLGLEGIALLRAFSGMYDRDFTVARLREIQTLLNSAEALGDGVEARPITTREGYDRWAPFYDEPGNELLDIEQPIVHEILDSLPVGVALDGACGTGRYTVYLASLGHKVIGVDTSPEMLARAGDKMSEGEFYEADLHSRFASDYL